MKQWTCQCGSLSPLIGRESRWKNFEYSISPVLRSSPRPPFRTLHCISASMAPIVSSTADLADLLNHQIGCDCQVYAERLWNAEHQPITNLPVAYRFAVFLTARIHPRRQPFAARRILISQQCDKLCSPNRA